MVLLCPHCGFENATSPSEGSAMCSRCSLPIGHLKPFHIAKTMAYASTALILCFPAYLLPFMAVQMYGRASEPTIWEGVVSLIEAGSWFVAGVVFFASLVLPILKIFILFGLALAVYWPRHPLFNTKLHNVIEQMGRWSMIDVFLLAILVASLKLGELAEVSPRPGSILFALVVIFTMLASNSFDPKWLWRPNRKDPSP